jgi:integrase
MVYKQRKSSNWWYKFTWNGQLIRESTKQANRRVAEQMEAARKTQLAKREVGIKDPVPVPTLQEFAEKQFLPFAEKQFAARPKTLGFYENGVKNLLAHKPLSRLPLDAITTGNIATYAAARKEAGLAIASVNRELQVLRRMFRLAQEWRKVERLLARVSMVPKENHRERVLTDDEEAKYLEAATTIGAGIQEAYQRALCGIRAAQRGEQPTEPRDPFLLRDVATTLLDCALRPEECFRLRWDQVRDGSLHILHGKTASARRVIPLSDRAAAVVEARRQGEPSSSWVFPAPTRSGPHREVQPEEAAPEGDQGVEGSGLRPLRVPAHLPDAVGRAHGPLHSRLLGRPLRLRDDEKIRPPAEGNRSQGDGEGSRGAYFWAYHKQNGLGRVTRGRS